ncbi:AidA/PixA family protein [Streptomyces tibetensis]|uniref:AidA/PixA family protein n=1 Tax=Streptomyces tibetensis TaxID=2382123 RepID=A0ABW6MYU1_9ACTN
MTVCRPSLVGCTEGRPEFETQRYADHYWRTTVKRPGKVVYHFSFQILDRHRQLRGYFQWDRS